jgi:hypothetical protein
MGGRALKSIETRRCSREEFNIFSSELTNILKHRFNKVGIPMFYNNKPDFGDIDIVVSEDTSPQDMRLYLDLVFKPREIFHNGNCWSFDYNSIQVDIIITPNEHYETTLFYMGGNDIGNFVGRIAQGFGLKYGQEGLWMEHYFKGSNIARIPISKNYADIFNFLGLSYERYLQGFDELEDIFQYISSSKFFNWKMFQMGELNKINRDRNVKRKSYMSFLEWMDANVADENHEYQFDKSQEEYNKMIAEAFPYANLELEIRRVEYEYCKKLYAKAKFNGNDIIKRYGINGKEIGTHISSFKNWVKFFFPKYVDYDDYILNNEIAQIYNDFERATYLKPIM